ncbi:hypothetical protein IscW_ISCW004947 [Ixodes scapularis]|uniref:Uncharacterized protein n=1 Tax=Ixodes scapularis TaxID=6945 RepID=B7PJU0_IXOSC|nr:hypothetical protein IscW_ISCW004947 [Ixodes scapularis]|eukprot:XP_002408628.1 hypothetical protein IscW_ISCW004947 [Ixodes scapularis]
MGDVRARQRDMFSDLLSVCPVLYFADFLVRAGARSVRRYLLSRRTEPRAQRSYALSLVFGDPMVRGSNPRLEALSLRMIHLWTSFAKTGRIPRRFQETIAGYTIEISDVVYSEEEAPFLRFREGHCNFLRPHYSRVLNGIL